jgi:hypothetical protein
MATAYGSSQKDPLFDKASEALDLAEKRIYEPISLFTKGIASFNFLVYKTAKDISNPTTDSFFEFAKETEKKLGVHPLYLLHLLKKEYRKKAIKLIKMVKKGIKETYLPTLDEFMSGQNTGKGVNNNIDEQIELNRVYRNGISKAIRKISRENPFYVI